jgi:Plasmid pRiA4b ORF-3-like protein
MFLTVVEHRSPTIEQGATKLGRFNAPWASFQQAHPEGTLQGRNPPRRRTVQGDDWLRELKALVEKDCGGIPGFYELLEAIADPAHPSHAHLKEWAADHDPTTFDTLPIKYALGRIANRRNAARTRLSKKKHLGSAA